MMQRFDDAMARMADVLIGVGDLGEALTRITTAAVETVPGADLASISVRHADGTLETSVGTERLAYQADRLQYELREGPCYNAVTCSPQTYSGDLARDPNGLSSGPERPSSACCPSGPSGSPPTTMPPRV